jgi:chromosome segregation ATPase
VIGRYEREMCVVSERNASLKEALDLLKKTQTRLQTESGERERQHSISLQEAVCEGHKKLQESIEHHTHDLHGWLIKEQSLKTDLAEADARNQHLITEMKGLEESTHEKTEKIRSLGENLEEHHSRSTALLSRYERGQLDHLERALVLRVHEAAQSSYQRELIDKNNEIARVGGFFNCGLKFIY